MVNQIKFREISNQELYDKSPVKFLQYSVVNRETTTQFFEDCKFRDVVPDEDSPLLRIPVVENPPSNTSVTIIFSPNYVFSYIRANSTFTHPEKNVIRPTKYITARPISDNENLALSNLQKNGIDAIYANQYGIYLTEEGVEATYYEEDHETAIITTNNNKHNSCYLWRNVPWHPMTTVHVKSTKDAELFSIAPYHTASRHNIEKTPLHKFDQWFLNPGEVVRSTVFDYTEYSHVYVVYGKILIDGTEVSKYEFYEHDPISSVNITAIENSFVIQLTKVTSIDFTDLT